MFIQHLKRFCILCLVFTQIAGLTAMAKPLGNFGHTKQQEANYRSLDRPSFSLNYPTTWDLNETGMMGSTFFLFSPLEATTDNFQENINYIKEVLPPKRTLQKYAEISIALLEDYFPEFKLQTNEIIQKNGLECLHIIYTAKHGKHILKIEQYGWLKNGEMHILTFTAKKDTYDSYKKTALHVIDSFKLK